MNSGRGRWIWGDIAQGWCFSDSVRKEPYVSATALEILSFVWEELTRVMGSGTGLVSVFC